MGETYVQMMKREHKAEIAAWATMVGKFCKSLGGPPVAIVGNCPDAARVMLEMVVHEREKQVREEVLEQAAQAAENCAVYYWSSGEVSGPEVRRSIVRVICALKNPY